MAREGGVYMAWEREGGGVIYHPAATEWFDHPVGTERFGVIIEAVLISLAATPADICLPP